MLTEHAKAIHAQFINRVKNFRNSFCYFLLKLCDYLEDIIISKDCIHSDDNFPHDKEDIFFNLNVNHFKQFRVRNSDRL